VGEIWATFHTPCEITLFIKTEIKLTKPDTFKNLGTVFDRGIVIISNYVIGFSLMSFKCFVLGFNKKWTKFGALPLLSTVTRCTQDVSLDGAISHHKHPSPWR
jgi:hypothetical protein